MTDDRHRPDAASEAGQGETGSASPRAHPEPGGGVHFEIGNVTNSQFTVGDVAGGDIIKTEAAPAPPTSARDETRVLVRVLALVIGVAGLVAAVIWLQKALPGFTPEFLIPLVIILVAVVLGAMGVLKPDAIASILLGFRNPGQK